MQQTLKTIALSLALGIAAAGAASAEPVKVGFAAEPYPPFTSPDASGNWEGWEVEFQKAVCAESVAQLGMEHLEGYRAVMPEIAREIDGGHAAPAELPLNRVAAG